MNNKPQKKTNAPFEGAAAASPEVLTPPPPRQTPYMGTSGSFSAFQFPGAFRDLAEKSVNQARDSYAKMKSATEDATGLVETTVENARSGAMAIGVKALDAAKTNSDASFALARELFGARTFAEVIELQSTFARRFFESVTAQVKELQELTGKVVTDTTKPVAEKVQKSFKVVAA